jgi:hypothetical protein
VSFLLCLLVAINGSFWVRQTADAHLQTEIRYNLGLDSCDVNGLRTAALQAWYSASNYRWVGAYIGGETATFQNCYKATANWVSTVHDIGYSIGFIWDALQPPCSGNTFKISTNSGTAFAQGQTSGAQAVQRMTDIGVDDSHSIVFLDIEPYDQTDAGCRLSVNKYIRGWVETVETESHRSGVYGATASTMKGMITDTCWTPTSTYWCPSDIWFAHHTLDDTLWGESDVPDTYWSTHRRLHQYRGDHSHTIAGYTLSPIDDDCAGGHLAGSGVTHPVTDGHSALTEDECPGNADTH